MQSIRKSFCIICIANYCRSPVLEHLLRNKYGDKYEFYSAGLSPLYNPSMDPRSENYLKEKGIIDLKHTPKNISKKMLQYFDFFIAIDIYVLNKLNLLYPSYKHKFILATSEIKNMDIIDPYHKNDDEYKRIMDLIDYVADTIELEK